MEPPEQSLLLKTEGCEQKKNQPKQSLSSNVSSSMPDTHTRFNIAVAEKSESASCREDAKEVNAIVEEKDVRSEMAEEMREFRRCGRLMVDYVADYIEQMRARPVTPSSLQQGYLLELLPKEAPEDREDFESVLKDVEHLIMPGVCPNHLLSLLVLAAIF